MAKRNSTDTYVGAVHRYDTIQRLIEDRHAELAQAIMKGDLDAFLKHYSDDVVFNDWTHNRHLVGIEQVRDFFQYIFSNLGTITLDNATISCSSPELVTWEFEKHFKVIGAMPHLGREVGQKIKKRALEDLGGE